MRHNFASESRACLDALPSTVLCACSTDVGWTSLLVRHSRCTGAYDPYETLPTSDYKLVIVTRGEVDVASYEESVWRKAVYRAGSAGLSAPGEIDRLHLRLRGKNDAFEKLHIFIPQAFVEEAADQLRRPAQKAPEPSRSALVFNDHGVAHIAAALIAAMRDGAPDFFAEAAAQWLAVQLLTISSLSGPEDDLFHTGPISDARLRRALEYMSANLDQPLTLDAIAKEAGVSKFHFVRLFCGRIGETPMQHLLNLRMNAAVRLLSTSDLSVARIGLECGYAHVSHFSTAFHRQYGCTPGRYRKNR